MKEQVQLFKIIFDFLDHLSEEQLNSLVTQKAKLKLDQVKDAAETPGVRFCMDEVCKRIESFKSREEAVSYINELSLLKAELKGIAKNYNIPLGSKETNSQIIDKIVENAVGSKLKFDALLSTDLKR